ncbi:putative carnitine O-palmitoyltransferase II [Trypanosoma conorhini]|uniref:Putative carnitine O-palmitoyltransferase II n=1 Tax=Trypanosoma conorhini TaxID=83891 RepID=A0A3R7LM43_9TRYP|nr:putative carnitine O-palmitoyltransferase II [Trypanosoma conorhini]RNE99749.1 putative carnitine O-palmitoyltransferase II [Trypanosoma conorhini]
MLRRSCVLATASGPLALPADIHDWAPLRQYLEKSTVGGCTDRTVLDASIIPTRHLQRSLFRLPVPKLKNTCSRYLNAVKPLVSPKQFEATTKIVNDFESGEGRVLQEELVRTDKANKHTSYISADWFDFYLSDRRPLPINTNPCLLTRRDQDKPDMLTRATFWITSSVAFYRMYLENTLKPDIFSFAPEGHYSRRQWFERTVALSPRSIAAKVCVFGSNFQAFPLDMSQYSSLMNSTRLPGTLKDEVRCFSYTPHIIVQFRGHQYVVNVADSECRPLPEEQIYARLKAIIDLNPSPPKVDIGVFTSTDRPTWHAVRTEMLRDNENQNNFELLDSAMFVMNLDDDVDVDFLNCRGAVDATRVSLVKNTNRWWDKSISVIVTKDGFLAINFEHSWGDGVAVLRSTQDIFNHSIMRSSKSMRRDAAPTEGVKQLRWRLTHKLEQEGVKAKLRLDADIRRMDLSLCIVKEVGTSDPIFRTGPVKGDPFLQLVMQLAWWRLYKSTVSTYESASTAAYRHGRTECIRSATMESQAFTMLMDAPHVAASEKVEAMFKALRKHAELSKNAKMGEGVDRHLFALQKVAQRRNPCRVPDLFSSPSYTTLCSNMMSTSTLRSDALVGGGFGPVSPGYGIGYAADRETLAFNVSCWKEGGPRYSADDFTQALYAAALDMYNLLRSAKTG